MALSSVQAWAWAGSILVLSAASACAPDAHDPQAQPLQDPPALAGEYTATSGGDVATIGFYGSEYALRPASCGAGDAACIVHGTYRVDPSAGTLVLQADGAATETIWPLRFDPRAIQAEGAAIQSLHPLITSGGDPSPLIGKPSCLLNGAVADSFTADGVTYSRGNTADDFEKNVIGARGDPAHPLGDSFTNDRWFQIEDRNGVVSCADAPDGLPAGAHVVMWHTLQLVDFRGCAPAKSGWSQTHSYFMTDGTPVATFNEGSRKTDYTMTPLAVLMKVMGKCR
jgi:hypothetical protein